MALVACGGGEVAAPVDSTASVEEAVSTETTAAPTPAAETSTTTTSVVAVITTSTPPETTTSPAASSTTTSSSLVIPTLPPEEAAAANLAYEASFAVYEASWSALRSAIRSPADPGLRSELEQYYTSPEDVIAVFEFLDSMVESSNRSIEDPDDPSTLTFLGALGYTEDSPIALMYVCEVLRSDVIDKISGEVVYDGTDAYRHEVTLTRSDGQWRIEFDRTVEEYAGAESCDG